MPILPDQSVRPYDTVGYALRLARVAVNDVGGPNGLAGDLLASSDPRTGVLLNEAWRLSQDILMDAGVETLVKEALIAAMPAAYNSDPSVSVWIDWAQSFDGTAAYDTPHLPTDLIVPLGIKERQSGSNGSFCPVQNLAELPEGYQGASLRFWEWREDKVWFKGASQVVDLKVRYSTYFPELAPNDPDPTHTATYGLPVVDETVVIPVMRVAPAIAYFVAAQHVLPLGSDKHDMLYAKGEAALAMITNRTARRKAAIPYRRQAYR